MMDFTEEMELLKCDAMNPTEQKQVQALYRYYLERFWTNLEEPDLPGQQNELWWWTKMHFLSRLTEEGNTTAKAMLEMELIRNAAKINNPNYEQTRVRWK